jgi:hypothetical protein
MFLVDKGACAVVKDIAFHWRERLDMFQNAFPCPLFSDKAYKISFVTKKSRILSKTEFNGN